jgi:hypothetical protein
LFKEQLEYRLNSTAVLENQFINEYIDI